MFSFGTRLLLLSIDDDGSMGAFRCRATMGVLGLLSFLWCCVMSERADSKEETLGLFGVVSLSSKAFGLSCQAYLYICITTYITLYMSRHLPTQIPPYARLTRYKPRCELISRSTNHVTFSQLAHFTNGANAPCQMTPRAPPTTSLTSFPASTSTSIAWRW